MKLNTFTQSGVGHCFARGLQNFKNKFFCSAIILGALLASLSGCRKETDRSEVLSSSSGQPQVSFAPLAQLFYDKIGRHWVEGTNLWQKKIYTGNFWATDDEFADAIQSARNDLFRPWKVMGIEMPAWQGIYFFTGVKAHLKPQDFKGAAELLSRYPQVLTAAAAAAGSRVPPEKIQKMLLDAFQGWNAADSIGVAMAASPGGAAEALVFAGADRGRSASGQGKLYWGVILAGEFGPLGLGREFVFDENGLVENANVGFLGFDQTGAGGGAYYSRSNVGEQALGIYAQLAAGGEIGMFAQLNTRFLPEPVRRMLGDDSGSSAGVESSPADSLNDHYADEASFRDCIRNGGKGGCVNKWFSANPGRGSFLCKFPRNVYLCLVGDGGESCIDRGECTQKNQSLSQAQRGIFGRTTSIAAQPAAEQDPKVVMESMGCNAHNAQQGAWLGCVSFLKWRAQVTGRTLNSDLTSDHLAKAVTTCNAYASFTSCTNTVLGWMGSAWPTDNFACLAGEGGYSCKDKFQ